MNNNSTNTNAKTDYSLYESFHFEVGKTSEQRMAKAALVGKEAILPGFHINPDVYPRGLPKLAIELIIKKIRLYDEVKELPKSFKIEDETHLQHPDILYVLARNLSSLHADIEEFQSETGNSNSTAVIDFGDFRFSLSGENCKII
ncbi:hypothetical protein IT400_01880, partial [Candidatus Nomurabacteria bacterium]|nr:hypothetical protein [Candidatus Nomurabacteria bacterium]